MNDPVRSGFFGTFGVLLALFVILVLMPAAGMLFFCGGCVFLTGSATKIADEGQRAVQEEQAKRRTAREKADRSGPVSAKAIEFPSTDPVEPFSPVDPTEPEKTVLSKEEVDALAEEARKQREEEREKLGQESIERGKALIAKEKAERTRVWQSPSGSFKLEAEFIRYSNGKVTLRKADDSEIEVDVAKLSDDDRAWIEERRPKP